MPPRTRKTPILESANPNEPETTTPLAATIDPAASEPAAAEQTLAAPAPDRWVQVGGEPTHSFCQICLPAGPPEGVGVIGCAHSQWVRVRGEA